MELLNIIISWVSNHWADILAVWGALVLLANTIVKITPTPKDDALLAKVLKFVDWFATVYPKKPANPAAPTKPAE